MKQYVEHIASARERKADRDRNAYVNAGPKKEHLQSVIRHIQAKGLAEDIAVLNTLRTASLRDNEREVRIRALWKRIRTRPINP